MRPCPCRALADGRYLSRSHPATLDLGGNAVVLGRNFIWCSIALVVAPAILGYLWIANVLEPGAPAGLSVYFFADLVAAAILGTTVVFRRRLGGTRPILERVSTETTVTVFWLPMAAAITGGLMTAAATIVDLHHSFLEPPNTYAASLTIVALGMGVGLPLATLNWVADERAGVSTGLFNSDASDVLMDQTLTEQWKLLVNRRRRWAEPVRVAALGSLTQAPTVAWPRGPQVPAAARKVSVVVASIAATGMGGAVLFFGYCALARDTNLPFRETSHIQFAVTVFVVAFTLLNIYLWAYVQLQSEQLRAELLRLASAERDAQKKQREQAAASSNSSAPPEDRCGPLTQFKRSELLLEAFRWHRPKPSSDSPDAGTGTGSGHSSGGAAPDPAGASTATS